MKTGKLVLCATPIGNLEDVSQRALKTIGSADVLACEDTRRTRKLLSRHGIRVRDIVSYNEKNERKRAQDLVGLVSRGRTVVLVSDAGVPGLSDPGYRLVRACVEQGLAVSIVPGPNAAISALAISGLPPGRYIFEGFLPRKRDERRRRIGDLAQEERTLVLYESPHRVADTLLDLADVLGGRRAALVRELTKMHEEVRRGTLAELAEGTEQDAPRGEIALVVAGATGEHREQVSDEELARRARELMAQGISRREALSQVAREARVPRRRVFDALVRAAGE